MANENKNINELVSDDDDPTAELEILSFREFDLADVEPESESNTHGFGKGDDTSSSGQSIPELKSDLERRTQTIGRLQYDIEQLRARWLGLETEIEAREQIVNDLLRDVDGLKGELSRKDKLLKKRNRSIKSLKSKVRQRDEIHRSLEQQHAELDQELAAQRSTNEDEVSALDEARIELEQRLEKNAAASAENEREHEETRAKLETAEQRIASLRSDNGQRSEAHQLLEQLHSELERQLAATAVALEEKENELEKTRSQLLTVQNQSADELALARQTGSVAVKEAKAQLAEVEKYADTLRYKLQDFAESQSRWSKEREELSESVEQLSERNWSLSEQLESEGASLVELQAALKQQHIDHEQEICTLRFELGEAQDTAIETGALNTQLASDLVDSHRLKEELERMVRENDEAAQKRIQELENQLSERAKTTEDLEQKLDTKSNTITVLLSELAKKSEQIESIGEIENVIQEIDNRMSVRFEDQDSNESPSSVGVQEHSDRDRITRVLIGDLDSQELRFPLFKNRLTIGRNDDNDIQLKTTYISRRHAVILTEGDATRIIDWGSKNGVFVNSERIKEHFLSNGDIVAIGDVKFRYEERPKRDA